MSAVEATQSVLLLHFHFICLIYTLLCRPSNLIQKATCGSTTEPQGTAGEGRNWSPVAQSQSALRCSVLPEMPLRTSILREAQGYTENVCTRESTVAQNAHFLQQTSTTLFIHTTGHDPWITQVWTAWSTETQLFSNKYCKSIFSSYGLLTFSFF